MKISGVAFWCTTGCWIVAMIHMFTGRYDAASACAVVGLYGPAFEIMGQMRGRK